MNKQKIMKWALPALLMSGMTFELMPGSVKYYAKELVTAPEGAAWNFFAPPTESMAASCLPIAGVVTLVAMVLALAAVCLRKNNLYKAVSWCSLAAGALAAIPYIAQTEGAFLQPNVVVIMILTGSWLLALSLDKKKDKPTEEKTAHRRLK